MDVLFILFLSCTIEKMEDMLIVWIQDLVYKRIPLLSMAIREQALSFHEYLVQKSDLYNSTKCFLASKGWFEKFKNRYGLRCLSTSREIASADHEATIKVKPVIQALITEKGFKIEFSFTFLTLK